MSVDASPGRLAELLEGLAEQIQLPKEIRSSMAGRRRDARRA
jgi:hypothetical protein